MKQGERWYTIFPDGEIVKYQEGDDGIEEAEIAGTFPKAKKVAKDFLELRIKRLDTLMVKDLQ